MRHHTKDKGAEGLGQVIADLMTSGVHVAVPLSEHLPFDLVAIDDGGAMRRVQVRYRTSLDAAHVRCHLGTSWADRNGTHKRAFDAASIDALAIYCPCPRTFVYLLANELPASYVNLRLAKAKTARSSARETLPSIATRGGCSGQWLTVARGRLLKLALACPRSSADRAVAFSVRVDCTAWNV